VEISAWVTPLQIERSNELIEVHELTINLSLSEETATLARTLMRQWVAAETTIQEITDLISAISDSHTTDGSKLVDS